MAIYTLHIVALPHWELKDCLDEFYAEAMGQSITLMQDIANDVDDKAVIAYDWLGRHIGFVTRSERLMALEMLLQQGKNSLHAVVREMDTEHHALYVEVESDWDGKMYGLPLNNDYESWHYTGPRMKPTRELYNLHYMMSEIMYRLNDDEIKDRVGFKGLMQRFCKFTKLDITAEMADYRNQLKAKLRDKGLDDFAKMVELENGHAGRESSNGVVKDYWLNMLTSQGRGSKLYAEREKHSVAEIERQLMEFPDDLYNTWVNNRDQFVAKVYYMHIPKQVLWGFLSGIAFVEMMRGGDKGTAMTEEEMRHKVVNELAEMYCYSKDKLIDLRITCRSLGWKEEEKYVKELISKSEKANKNIGNITFDHPTFGGDMNVSGNLNDVHDNNTINF